MIAIASTVVFARVLILVGVTSPRVFSHVAAPLTAMFLALTSCVLVMLLSSRQRHTGMPSQGNPSELRSQSSSPCCSQVVLMAVAAAQENFGDRGLYLVGLLAGLTDMDAITLSTVQLVQDGKVATGTGWRLILVAAMSNLVFKSATVWLLGSRPLLVKVGTFFALASGIGSLILILWPL